MTVRRALAVGLIVLSATLAACTRTPAVDPSPPSLGPTTSESGSTTSGSAAPVPPAPAPLPPLAPGTARGELLVVQRAEDAALVSDGDPIRLTLARTKNEAAWFTASPQKLAGTMSTEQAMLTLGWRPADDGTTAPMPPPRPNGLLAYQEGTLAFTVQRANVRGDGTLVLDIRPIGPPPPTVESFGPVSLSLDGVPGVLELGQELTPDLAVRVVITGSRNQQAVVQVVDSAGDILESAFVSSDRPTADAWLDVTAGTTTWSDPVLTFIAPTEGKPGTVRVTGILSANGEESPLDRVIARWSLPLTR